MAFTPNQYLYRPSNVTLRDQQHAARVFTDDQFRLAPKHKFLFHVAFSLNPACLRDIDLVQRHRNEINLLVKECDLPNFNLTVETFNQYNRKKNVQLTHKYQPLNITFHDDNMGLINQMWQNYYAYYYADSASASVPGAFNRTATKNANYINTAYGLDNRSSQNFFNYITIYQMARHEYVSYTLVNPVINSWNHNKVGYATSGTHDNTMTLMYESVSYGSGYVSEGDPEGFGVEHYDKTPSSLIGSVDAAPSSPTFADVGISADTKTGIVNTLTQQMNTYLNTKEKEGVNTTSNILKTVTGAGTQPSINGLQGFQFPTNSTAKSTTVVAKQITIIGNNNTINIGG